MHRISGAAPAWISTCCCKVSDHGALGILFALGLLIWLAYRGWSVLLAGARHGADRRRGRA